MRSENTLLCYSLKHTETLNQSSGTLWLLVHNVAGRILNPPDQGGILEKMT